MGSDTVGVNLLQEFFTSRFKYIKTFPQSTTCRSDPSQLDAVGKKTVNAVVLQLAKVKVLDCIVNVIQESY